MQLIFLILRRTFIAFLGIAVISIVVGAAYLESTLPSVEMLKDMRLSVPLRVYSSDGKLIAEFGEARRSPIRLADVPQDLINAILATEDRRFYDHAGVDLRGLMRAAVHLLMNVSVKQGGSTITMQVARNYFLTRKKTIIRKISEILLALKIEKEFNKNEILELYLNRIYFGKRAYGVAAAAEVYYGTTVDQLKLDQIAMIAGLPQAPSSINPLHDKDAAYKRRKHVLERMLSYDFITEAQYKEALDAPLPTRYHGRTIELDAPYVAEMVRQELFSRYGEAAYSLGYDVYTTIDSHYQATANQSLRRALIEYDQRHGFRKIKTILKVERGKKPEHMTEAWVEALDEMPVYSDIVPGAIVRLAGNQPMLVLLQNGDTIEVPNSGIGWARGHLTVGAVIYVRELENKTWKVVQIPNVGGAFVALQPDTGTILALVGGFDYNLSNFNRAVQAERQPGSNFKPFLYAAALAQGYTLASVFNDGPIVYVDPVSGVTWRPKNASHKFYGPTRLRVALKKSQNLVTVRVLQAIGIDAAIDFIEKFGFDREKMPRYLPLALGAGTATPLQMAAGYAAFANGGNRVTPNFIKTIKDYEGNVVQEFSPAPAVNFMSPEVAYLITSALQDAIQSGTGIRAKSLGRMDLAGKTGTTNDWMDAWYSGYNRDIVATAWVGFDELRSLREYGSSAALPMWMYFMDEILKDKPEHAPEMPPGIVTLKINPGNGRPTGEHGGGIYEIFAESALPSANDSNMDNYYGYGSSHGGHGDYDSYGGYGDEYYDDDGYGRSYGGEDSLF